MSLALYIPAYEANLAEASRELRESLDKLDLFRSQEMVFRDDEGVTRTKGPEAARVYQRWVLWNSNWNHWAQCLRQAQVEAGQLVTAPRAPGAPPPQQQDLRLPPERDDEPPPPEGDIPF